MSPRSESNVKVQRKELLRRPPSPPVTRGSGRPLFKVDSSPTIPSELPTTTATSTESIPAPIPPATQPTIEPTTPLPPVPAPSTIERTISKSAKRRERKRRIMLGPAFIPASERIVSGLRRLVTQEFPTTDLSNETCAARAFWNSRITELSHEVKDDYYDVTSIVSHRFQRYDGMISLEFDTRYVGYETEESWQPYEYVVGLEAFNAYIIAMSD